MVLITGDYFFQYLIISAMVVGDRSLLVILAMLYFSAFSRTSITFTVLHYIIDCPWLTLWNDEWMEKALPLRQVKTTVMR